MTISSADRRKSLTATTFVAWLSAAAAIFVTGIVPMPPLAHIWGTIAAIFAAVLVVRREAPLDAYGVRLAMLVAAMCFAAGRSQVGTVQHWPSSDQWLLLGATFSLLATWLGLTRRASKTWGSGAAFGKP